MTANQDTLYAKLIDITSDYLGPASERFVNRQIEQHLQKRPEEVTAKDVSKLLDWMRLSISMLTDDEKIVDEFTCSIHELTPRKPNMNPAN